MKRADLVRARVSKLEIRWTAPELQDIPVRMILPHADGLAQRKITLVHGPNAGEENQKRVFHELGLAYGLYPQFLFLKS
jgi:hypothetical protein